MKSFKPMLAVDCGDVATLRFPVLTSPKLDGVRCIIIDNVLMSRSLKPIPNKHVQKLFHCLPNWLDGELIAGDPCAPDAYRKTVSMVMSDDKPLEDLRYYVFDRVYADVPFETRLERAKTYEGEMHSHVKFVQHYRSPDLQALLALESAWVNMGYEGAMLRDPQGPYKFGRSTRKEGYLLKLKRFADSEAEVLGVVELMHNGNEAKTNALGHTERSTAKAGKSGMGVLGALQVRDVKTGVEFEIGTGFTAAERAALWNHKHRLIGELAKYKYFAGGSKDKPRFPVFLGWRDRRDT
jgi:DNA ligase-1